LLYLFILTLEILTDGFSLLHKYLDLFDSILNKTFSKLKKRFDEIEFSYLLWLSKWLQTLFTYNFEFSLIRKFWDIILFNNLDYILLISLAIIDYHQNKLINIKSLDEMVSTFPIIYEIGHKIDKTFEDFFDFIYKKVTSKKYQDLIKFL